MNDVPENSLILFEDIDCMKAGNRRDDLSESRETQHLAAGTEKSDIADRFGVTLSGLLNVLDGVHAPENVVYVMTTNKVEALDPALLSPDASTTGSLWGRLLNRNGLNSIAGSFPKRPKPTRESSRRHTAPRQWQSSRACFSRWSKIGKRLNRYCGNLFETA